MSDIQKIAKWATEKASTQLPGLIFVRRKDKAKQLAAAIEAEMGCFVPWVTSEVPQKTRDEYISKMKDGRIPVAVATSAWSTGLDIPELRWVSFADEGRAPIWVTQAAVRGSRLAEGKTSYEIYDLSCKDSPERRQHLQGYVDDKVVLDSLYDEPRRSRGHEARTARCAASTVWAAVPEPEALYIPWYQSWKFHAVICLSIFLCWSC